MRRFLIRLAIALVAFIVGVTAATVFGGVFGLRTQQHHCAEGDRSAFIAPPPMPAEQHSCRMHFDVHAIPEPPAMPEPPKPMKGMRIRVRAADGTVKEVEIKTEKDAEQ